MELNNENNDGNTLKTPSKRGSKYAPIENLLLTKAYLKASESANGVSQRKEVFASNIRDIFGQMVQTSFEANEINKVVYEEALARPPNGLVDRFAIIKKECLLYHSFYSKAKKLSGYNEEKCHQHALEEYNKKKANKVNKKTGSQVPFPFMECFQVLICTDFCEPQAKRKLFSSPGERGESKKIKSDVSNQKVEKVLFDN
jgi:hypothetical protein